MSRTLLAGIWGPTVAIACCLQSGCAGWPGHDMFSGISLPSPMTSLASTGESKSEGIESVAPTLAAEMARGRTYERNGQSDKARKVYEDLRKRYPDNADVAHRLGVVADTQRRHGEAEQLFLIALEKEPNNSEVMCDLGYCYYLQGRLDKAERYLAEAVNHQPANPRYRNNLGLVLGHMGRYDDALAQFRAAGSEGDAYFNLAFVCASQDKVVEAKKCFQKALMVDPNHEQAREALASFHDYEQMSPQLRELQTEYADNDVRYVPHQQALAMQAEGDVQQTAAESSLPNSMNVSRSSRALQMKSRGMLNRNMQSQRQGDQPQQMQAAQQ